MDDTAALRIRDPLWPRIAMGALAACVIGIGIHSTWTVAQADIGGPKRALYFGITFATIAYYVWFGWLMWWSDLHRDWRLRADTQGLVVDAADLFHKPLVLDWSAFRGFLVDLSHESNKPVRFLWARSNWGKRLAALPVGPTPNLMLILNKTTPLANARLGTRLYCGPEVRAVVADMENPDECKRVLETHGVKRLENVELHEVKKTRVEARRSWPLFLIVLPALAGLFGIAMILGELD